jgi:tetratricopeptide (TPR) repeat protein
MLSRFRICAVLFFALLFVCASPATAQTSSDETEGADEAVELFQQGQDAHGAGDLKRALELYERAIKLRPEFPEAEHQRATALTALNRLPEAEASLRRSIELQPDWTLPHITLGKLLMRLDRFDEAETLLARALELDNNIIAALVALADLRLRTKAPRDVMQRLREDLRHAVQREELNASAWEALGLVEVALGNRAEAMEVFGRVLALDKQNVMALTERAQLRTGAGNYEGALADALTAQRLAPSSPNVSLLVARVYALAGKTDEALKTLDALDEASRKLPEAVTLRNSLTKDCGESTADDIAATEASLKVQPRDAALLGCLGAALRTKDPARALELYRQAAEIEPRNARHAIGYAAALVQARRFAEAAIILRRVIAVEPDNLAAHTNLATALYELKQFPAALAEFRWLLEKKPDLAVAYFFIATAHDFLGEYGDALAAYETFLARADAQQNQLEIDKVNLRLPSLRNQVKRGEGVKKKKNGKS